jgi:hypothetical protein
MMVKTGASRCRDKMYVQYTVEFDDDPVDMFWAGFFHVQRCP